jgi:hypothetical protein
MPVRKENQVNKPIKREPIKKIPAVVKKKGVNSMMPGKNHGYGRSTLKVIKG